MIDFNGHPSQKEMEEIMSYVDKYDKENGVETKVSYLSDEISNTIDGYKSIDNANIINICNDIRKIMDNTGSELFILDTNANNLGRLEREYIAEKEPGTVSRNRLSEVFMYRKIIYNVLGAIHIYCRRDEKTDLDNDIYLYSETGLSDIIFRLITKVDSGREE